MLSACLFVAGICKWRLTQQQRRLIVLSLFCYLKETFFEEKCYLLIAFLYLVLTSPRTFSAAYHFTYLLSQIGKTYIAGVPSRQAGNTFMETTNFELPNTKISGSISNSYQMFFPDDLEKGKVLMPDFTMNWTDFAKYDFDSNAEILFVLDLLKNDLAQQNRGN